MSETDPKNPKYYFPDNPDLPDNRGLPFDLLSLVKTLPEIPEVAQKELEKFLKDKIGDGVHLGSPELVKTEYINGPVYIELGAHVHPGVSINGPVYIGAETHIHPGVSIDGPVYIGDKCSIRHAAQIRAGTILGNECVVGHSAEIKASICMSGAKMQNGVFVGNSILGVGARLGSGTILANRKFDQSIVELKFKIGKKIEKISTQMEFFGAVLGDYARLGGNVVTSPGTLVGPYTWVSSLISLYGFVERSKLVMLKQKLLTSDKEDSILRTGEGEYEHK